MNPQESLRVALISDTHGYLDERISALITGCDAIVHAGDIGSHSLLTSLESCMANIIAVRGNNDTPNRLPRQDRNCLNTLP